MTANGWLQIAAYVAVLLLCVKPLGAYMANVFEGRRTWADRVFGPLERLCYRLCGIAPASSMTWSEYALAFLAVNCVGMVLVYALVRLQGVLGLNPQGFPPVDPHTAFNIASSFATNTNWQNYGGESTLSYLVQMTALTVQNFLSAACGIAVAVVLARGLVRKTTKDLGNFYVDFVRSTLYVLMPLSVVLAVVLVSQGVVQNFKPYQTAQLVEPARDSAGKPATTQTLPMGPAASQIAIKQLGTNGGGFFNANSAHPYENPTPLSNFLEALSILLIPAALCYTYGRLVNDTRQGWALLAAMFLLLLPALWVEAQAESVTTPAFAKAGVTGGGNMEGKEVRFGVAQSSIWAVATTAASNGSVNAMHESYSPIGGLVPLFMMQMGEVVFGGVGSGLYGMVIFAIVAVFLAGLMVGRTPEYLGKKVEAFEMKMASLAILVPPLCVLAGTAIGVVSPSVTAGLHEHGPHGFSEILYAFTSMGNNNGSAFGGFTANVPLVNWLGGLCMLMARFWVALPVIAIAGSLAAKKTVPAGPGTLPTHNTLFVVMLAGVVVIVGALAFIPALALGPIVEHLRMLSA